MQAAPERCDTPLLNALHSSIVEERVVAVRQAPQRGRPERSNRKHLLERFGAMQARVEGRACTSTAPQQPKVHPCCADYLGGFSYAAPPRLNTSSLREVGASALPKLASPAAEITRFPMNARFINSLVELGQYLKLAITNL